ncbi:MAG: bi-domain-containing oxidoreductase [Verrucomicrobiota bacterium]|nr:bi-domain-containing oxidoreductase [Verrucomicrobiota bacterium]
MKQIAQYQDGRLEWQEVPRPVPPPGGVLVRTTHSVISIGTEKMKVEQAKMNLLQKAKARPDQVRKVIDTARNIGWKSAYEKVRNRLSSPTPLGYSAAGIVEAVDDGNSRFRVGDRVACGGAECAFHAEYIAVPDMLAAKVPDCVPMWQAAYTTLLSIAMQAVRQTEPRLGDRVLVMGQGLVGLLVTALLKANGARVMAVDLDESRRAHASAMGAERVVISSSQELQNEVREWTDGHGVDAAVVCVGTDSNAPIEQCADALRDRGRMIDVGITKIELPWRVFANKELDVRFSRSYGPGRYDPSYEWGGADYPIGYVRWTEQRNFQACLHLLGTGEIDLGAITTRRLKFEEALPVYQSIGEGTSSEVGVVMEYGEADDAPAPAKAKPSAEPGDYPSAKRLAKPVERLDVIGAGNFARTMLLPSLRGRIPLGTIINNTALSANHVRDKFGFADAATDPEIALGQAGDGAVLIGTRNHLHATMVVAALKAGRQVFVEKPLCLSAAELEEIDETIAAHPQSVQVGFNRRFAPASVELKRRLNSVPGPKSASFRVFAGKLDVGHWYANQDESGGRVISEGCHFLDYFCFLFGSRPVRVTAQGTWPAGGALPLPDSIAAQVEFADGSSGQLIYSAEGDSTYPKEHCTVYGAGIVADITNFQSLAIHQRGSRKRFRYGSKGHAEQMAAWLAFLRGTADHPLPYAEARQSMRLTFAVLESIREARSVEI